MYSTKISMFCVQNQATVPLRCRLVKSCHRCFDSNTHLILNSFLTIYKAPFHCSQSLQHPHSVVVESQVKKLCSTLPPTTGIRLQYHICLIQHLISEANDSKGRLPAPEARFKSEYHGCQQRNTEQRGNFWDSHLHIFFLFAQLSQWHAPLSHPMGTQKMRSHQMESASESMAKSQQEETGQRWLWRSRQRIMINGEVKLC